MILNHKIRLRKSNFIKDIKYERPSFSTDGKVFSCLVSNDYELSSGDILMLEINNGGIMNLKITTEKIIEQGWTEINTEFKLLDFVKNFPPQDNPNSTETTEWRYFIDNDGFIESGYEIDEGESLVFPTLNNVMTVEKGYDKVSYPNIITIPYIYYIENGILNYNGVNYVMNLDDNNDIAPIQTLGGSNSSIFIHDRERKKWKYKTRVIINLPETIEIDLDEVLLGKAEWFVPIDGVEYILKERPIDLSGHTFFQKYLPDEDALIPTPEGTGYTQNMPEVYDGIDEYGERNATLPTIKLWDGKNRDIQSRIIPSTDGGNMLILAVDSDKFMNFYKSREIIAERSKFIDTPYYLEDDGESVLIDDVMYPVETVDMVDFDGIREVIKENDKYYVKLATGRKVYFKKDSDEEYSLLFDKTIKYENIKSNKLKYNNKEYFKKIDETESSDENTPPIQYPFMIRTKPVFYLNIYDVEEPNRYYCKLNDDKTYSFSGFRNNKKEWIYRDMVINRGQYIFKLRPQTFFPDLNEPSNLKQLFEFPYEAIVSNIPVSISLQKMIAEMRVPVQLTTLHGTNINQEIDVKTCFVEEKKKEVVNRIIDMEKDMYSPMIITGVTADTGQVELTDAIDVNFYLHLRTRNDDWSVRDDKLIEVENTYGKKFITDTEAEVDGDVEYNDRYYKTAWNIMDYYSAYTPTLTATMATTLYYQPSDLLGFYDFNDDDIFYQKSKVSKTFLRMSFFDTKDPQTQSLLGTSTVFFDSRGFFGKFVKQMTNPNESVRYINPITWKGSSNTISCSKEAVNKTPDGGRMWFLDDTLRMSSNVSITNKIATDKSAEGFYNYIFREYSDKLHERRIYLKIQLNHAGHGEVIDLFQPMKREPNGTYSIADYNYILENYKNGLNINDLYNMMFIPVDIKYDEKHQKYCWYLPQSILKFPEDRKIKFNLYEVKIRKP